LFKINTLTANQNELTLNQNRIAVHLSKLAGISKEFMKKKDKILNDLVKNGGSFASKKSSSQNPNELSFAEEMQNLNKELNQLLNIIPK